MPNTPITLAAGAKGVPYSSCVTLSGNFEVVDFNLPKGLIAKRVGHSVCVDGIPLESYLTFPVLITVSLDCAKEQTLAGNLMIEACPAIPACDQCVYSWSITPTVVAPGQPQTTTFIPPDGCPANVTLSLDVFLANGTTPYLVDSQPLVLSIKAGETEYRPTLEEQGQVLVFKPSTVQQRCLATCVSSIAQQKRVVLTLPACATTWSLSTLSFVVGQQLTQTYSATGIPEGCQLTLGLYVGNAPALDQNGIQITQVLTSASPSVTHPQQWPSSQIGVDWNVRPLPTQSTCMRCTIQPARIDFDIVPAAACVTSWGISKTTFVANEPSTQTFSSQGIPTGCTLKIGAYVGNAPYISGGSQPVITLTADHPSATFPETWGPADVGVDYNFKPLPTQDTCMVCLIQPQRLNFNVTPAMSANCDITFNITNPSIITAGQSHVITVAGPAGANVQLTQVGTANGISVDVANPFVLPGPFPFNTGASVAGDISSFTFGLKAIGPSANLRVCGGPFIVGSNVPADISKAGGPTPASGVNYCDNTMTQYCGAAQQVGAGAFPITWRDTPAATETCYIQSTEITNAMPLKKRIVIPFSILAGSTTSGATNSPFISHIEMPGGVRSFARMSISRNQCDFNSSSVTYTRGGFQISQALYFSVNNSADIQADFNLTTGNWFVNLEIQLPASGAYDFNKLVQFSWYA